MISCERKPSQKILEKSPPSNHYWWSSGYHYNCLNCVEHLRARSIPSAASLLQIRCCKQLAAVEQTVSKMVSKVTMRYMIFYAVEKPAIIAVLWNWISFVKPICYTFGEVPERFPAPVREIPQLFFKHFLTQHHYSVELRKTAKVMVGCEGQVLSWWSRWRILYKDSSNLEQLASLLFLTFKIFDLIDLANCCVVTSLPSQTAV